MASDLSKGSYVRVGEGSDWENGYKMAYEKDSDVKNFHDKLEAGVKRVIDGVQNGRAEDTLSMDSLREVASLLAEKDEHIKTLILKIGKDVWKDRNLSELDKLYQQLNRATRDFYTKLDNWLKRVEGKRLLLESALQCIKLANPPSDKAHYTKCKEKLAEFKKAQNLLKEEFPQLLNSVREEHEQILEKLNAERKKSDRKFKRVRVLRKLSNIIFAAAFATIFIFSVVAAAMTAPPLVVAICAAPSLPIGSMGEWFNHWLKKTEKKSKLECEAIETMQKRTDGGLYELDLVSARVDRLEKEIGLIVESVDFFCKDDYNQQVAMDDIKEKLQRSKVQTDNLNNAVEFIREKRKSPEDQINIHKAVVDDMRRNQQSIKHRIIAQNVVMEDIKKQQKRLNHQINAQNLAVEDVKKQQQSFLDQIRHLCDHLNHCIQEIQDNRSQVFKKKSGITDRPTEQKLGHAHHFESCFDASFASKSLYYRIGR